MAAFAGEPPRRVFPGFFGMSKWHRPAAGCFHRGRFAVRVTWFDHRSGDSGVGHAVPGVGRTGTFWFFRPDNTELMVKLLDGRRINGYFWFFYGALTDVEYDLVVTDTLGERERTYHSPAGWSCGEGDTTAFPGAPRALARSDQA